MLFRQVTHDDLGCASYLIGDEEAGVAAVVDVLDVRERAEWNEGRNPGSVHMPYHDLNEIPEGIDPDLPVAVICSSGQRSAVAASLLSRLEVGVVIHIADGGVGTWERQGNPIEN